jgi:hypothetical protein
MEADGGSSPGLNLSHLSLASFFWVIDLEGCGVFGRQPRVEGNCVIGDDMWCSEEHCVVATGMVFLGIILGDIIVTHKRQEVEGSELERSRRAAFEP